MKVKFKGNIVLNENVKGIERDMKNSTFDWEIWEKGNRIWDIEG